jgi:membrane protease YdiL (CAAX protease family)
VHESRRGRSASKTSLIYVFVLALLVFEEALGLSSETAVISLFLALIGAFVTAILPHVFAPASSVRASLQGFSLIFLTRVAVAVIPALILPPVLLLITVYGVVLFMCAVYIVDRHLSPNSLGFHFSNAPLQAVGGLALGVVMGFTEFAILSSDIGKYVLFQSYSLSNLAAVVIVMFWFVALGEELLFRGLVQTSLERDLSNPTMALVLVSFTFAIMHLGYVTSVVKLLEIVYVYVAATVIGYSFMKTKSLFLPVVAHGVANTILFGILPYLL